jgi:hypothetical protein
MIFFVLATCLGASVAIAGGDGYENDPLFDVYLQTIDDHFGESGAELFRIELTEGGVVTASGLGDHALLTFPINVDTPEGKVVCRGTFFVSRRPEFSASCPREMQGLFTDEDTERAAVAAAWSPARDKAARLAYQVIVIQKAREAARPEA